MHLHEYQAKQVLQAFGIPIPPMAVVSNMADVDFAIKTLDLDEAVLKVQIHAGGRGKAGGVRFAKTKEEIKQRAHEMLGMRIINNQTGPAGLIASKLLISPPLSIKQEFYVAALIDRKLASAVILVSKSGGMDIEEAHETIHKEKISHSGKLYAFQLLSLAKFLGWEGEVRKQGISLLAKCAKAFMECDASLLEINPLVETADGNLFALDAKMSLDDNALFRQQELASSFDISQLPESERMAKQQDLAYVGLEGEIGCIVNGAGLAMATMDMIHYLGGKPANFLDVGGSATKEKISHGFKIILLDPHVRAIFVNIFGGIMDCAILAAGLVDATKQDRIKCPLIVRMEGTNVELGKKILTNSKLNFIIADTMQEGAKKAIEAAKWQS